MKKKYLPGRLRRGSGATPADRQTGKGERDQSDYLDDLMRSRAKGTVVFGLSGWMAVGNLNDAAHQDQRNANNPQ